MSSSSPDETSEKPDTEIRMVRSSLENDPVPQDEREEIVELLQDQKRRLKGLQEKLRKQEYDFTTVMEMANQIIARSVETSDLKNFIHYIKSTFQGHFGVQDVYIAYRQNSDGKTLSTLENGEQEFQLHPEDPFIRYLASQNEPVSKQEAVSTLENTPELQKITESNIQLMMALTRNIGSKKSKMQGILLLGPKIVDESYSDAEKQFLSLLGRMIAISLYNAELYQKSITDSLTGLHTRGHFDLRFNELIQSLKRTPAEERKDLSVILLDLDHFKSFNDQYGHQAGDRILKSVSQVLKKYTRESDLVARYGGEEFILAAPETDQRQGYIIAQRLRRNIEETSTHKEEISKPLSVTISAGVSTFPAHGREANRLIAKADDALYKAKEQGRNKVIVASD